MKKDTRKGDRHKPSEKRKQDRHRPGYIRPDRSEDKPPVKNSVPAHISKETMFTSWEDFLTRTTKEERIRWCREKARKANQKRLLSESPTVKLTAEVVWEVLQSYKGHCRYCGSLALENRPSKPDGTPLPWEHIGRRIGSLDHIVSRFAGGGNNHDNLAWACLWCNTWSKERKKIADDHGGLYALEPPRWEKVGHNWDYLIGEIILGSVRVTPKHITGQTIYHWNVDNGEYQQTTSTSTAKYNVEKNAGLIDIRKLFNALEIRQG